MSKQLKALEVATKHRFNEYVATHAAQSEWWETVDRSIDDPITVVEFIDNRRLPKNQKRLIVVSRYTMRLRVKLEQDEEKGIGWSTVPVALFENGESVGVDDPCNKLADIVFDYEPTPYQGLLGARKIIDHIEGLEKEGLLIPAREREFSL